MRPEAVILGIAILLPGTVRATDDTPKGVQRFAFAGYEWTVKRSERPTAPQNNRFGGLNSNVLLRPDGALILRVAPGRDGRWRSAEVILSRPLGYGTYRFRLEGRLDRLDDAVIAGLFTWDTRAEYANREIDIEFSTWGGQLRGANAQFVVQPHDAEGHLHRFAVRQEGDLTSHEFTWTRSRIDFASWHGHGRRPADSPLLIREWSYAGAGIPPPGNERVHINFYLFEGKAPHDDRSVELVVRNFEFEPNEDASR